MQKHYSMEKIRKGKISIAIRKSQGTPGTYLPETNDNSPEYEVLLPCHFKLKRVNCHTFEIVN